LDQFDTRVAEVMAAWQIPGLAMAVVQREKPPLLRCWGLRDVETGAAVGPDTLFPICSVTKFFTATGLALLVDEGKLDWDMPVREILPEFRLRDPVASEQATLRDLLTHGTACRGTTGCIWAAISIMPACSPRCAISNPARRSAAPTSTRT
jgi:CubicO group peptidase (beta-lactamase class C family)